MKEYLNLLDDILKNGRVKHNRTGIDTTGVFGRQSRFDLSKGFPLLTTKKMYWPAIVHELLWFISGDTNIKYLVDNNVHIWDAWAYKRYTTDSRAYRDKLLDSGCEIDYQELSQKQFIQDIKDCDMEEGTTGRSFVDKYGDLGEGTYGGMWRNFPHHDLIYDNHNCGVGDEYERVGIDQLQRVIDKLKTNPDDRRLIVSAWHPHWVEHCALPPCHVLFQFYTEELTLPERISIFSTGWNVNEAVHHWDDIAMDHNKALDEHFIPKRRLSCQLYQRSCDTFLGVPFNIASYSLLTCMVAKCVNMVPHEFVHTYGDLHIYNNHTDQVKLQLTREPMKLPTIKLANKTNLFDFKFKDIELVDYNSHPVIKGEVAV